MHPCPFSWSRIITRCNHYWPFFVFFNFILFVYLSVSLCYRYKSLPVPRSQCCHHSYFSTLNGGDHLLLSDVKCTRLTYTFGKDNNKAMPPMYLWKCFSYNKRETNYENFTFFKSLGAKQLAEEMVWGRNDYGMGAKRLR